MTPKREIGYILEQSKKLKAIGLLGGKCIKCGETNHVVLDFHHKNKEGKVDSIRSLKSYRWSRLKAEILKCELLCANCHGEIHANVGRVYNIKKAFLTSINKYACQHCLYNKIQSLDFHHIKDKSFTMNMALIRKISVSVNDMIAEAAKCIILCRNCHRIEHFDIKRYKKYKKQIINKSKNLREIQPKISRQEVSKMLKSGMKQIEIARHFNASKGTISDIVKELNMAT